MGWFFFQFAIHTLLKKQGLKFLKNDLLFSLLKIIYFSKLHFHVSAFSQILESLIHDPSPSEWYIIYRKLQMKLGYRATNTPVYA